MPRARYQRTRCMVFHNQETHGARARGQVFIEAMVAMTIVLVGLLGIFALITRSFGLTKTVSFQNIAHNLAAEGIEIAKNILDRDMFTPPASTANWGMSAIGAGQFHALSYLDTSFDNSAVSSCDSVPKLTVETATGRYSYASGAGQEETPFRRCVYLEPDLAGGSIVSVLVRSRVDWSSRGRDFSIVLTDRFFKWRP